MQEIRCPHCGEVFQVDESGYAQIVQQVRDKEFQKELNSRAELLEQQEKKDLDIARLEQEKASQDALAAKERALDEKEREIEQLKAQIGKADMEKKLAVSDAVREKESEINKRDQEITTLKGQLDGKENENKIKEQALEKQYKEEIRQKDELIEYYKDFKARQSTKMVGESLEQHCLTQFNTYRMGAFPNAFFEKDNDARSGSKGDFIFRESAEDGTEFISIMFEMKNEMDETATKHKNEDFFKELDKDRREKNCEYAVLVSLLESDSELYNNGIVDVSYKFNKMYVIRPQFFIPMITLLRNAARNSLEYRQQLAIVKNQQLDLAHFEENMEAFKKGFSRNYELASQKFQTAIDEIDKTINHLQKTKDALLSSENQLRLANSKAEELSIKKLTKNAPSVKALFDELGQKE